VGRLSPRLAQQPAGEAGSSGGFAAAVFAADLVATKLTAALPVTKWLPAAGTTTAGIPGAG